MTAHTTPETNIPRHRVLAKVSHPNAGNYADILTPDALLFLADLERRFGPQRKILIQNREFNQERYDDGEMPTQPLETQHIRNSQWEVAPCPEALMDRRVEITGPVDRKMMINALNSGAKMFMADFEDASSPTFDNMMSGQQNMHDYARDSLTLTTEKKSYALNEETATMLVRPRGWHLEERHITVDGNPMSASLCDFGLHIFHNGKKLADNGKGPFFYLPKIEDYREARLWNDVFNFSQAVLDIPNGTIKSTVLIETLPAAFQMEEILYVLKNHITGLNCGRWDYIFSYIKTLRAHPEYLLPERAQVGMDRGFLSAYAERLVQTCHRRRAHAMGGMAAQIPVKGDEAANDAAFEKVRQDKLREAKLGHDGTWVAHPALVPVAMEVFDEVMPAKHQIHKKRQNRNISDAAMLTPHTGTVTEAGVRTNINVGIRYIAAWLCGRGAVPIHNLMEDAATAEISRTQIWQWLRHGARVEMEGGFQETMTDRLYQRLLVEERNAIRDEIGADAFNEGRFPEASELFDATATASVLPEFLTLSAYDILEK
ncbi:malate synthase [Litorimonas cladophorae]|uniref:Malate synthase n=1 Tax=Litorimonas cladophorae TaxID=1220491 RepID=A0A918KNU4_9PROT|nr:malate synthase A [Litorimonas cladophorae]GGX70153.1 malate synthase [Litorimonas cladophorae]